jgi:hypothetical protein
MDFIKPGPNKRVCAFFIDSLTGQILGGVVSVILDRDISWLIWMLFILFKDCFGARSFGKYLVGTQVIDENNLVAKPSKTIIRNIFMVIPLFPLVEYVKILMDKKEGLRFGDKAAKTKVNDLKPQRKDSSFLWISVGLFVAVIILQLAIMFAFIEQNPELLNQ